MQEYIVQRCLCIAEYIIETKATVRQAAQKFGVSKSSVHKDMGERLPRVHSALAKEVAQVLSYNKAVRHLRGGAATRKKYIAVRERREAAAHARCPSLHPGAAARKKKDSPQGL
jgi:putative DeoR family transcriptional regulator (stage III sporulation protein D)